MIEGFGSGSGFVLQTNGSGFGTGSATLLLSIDCLFLIFVFSAGDAKKSCDGLLAGLKAHYNL
jgi:hypothetical protein